MTKVRAVPQRVMACCLITLLPACSGGGGSACVSPEPATTVACDSGSNCPPLQIAGDAPANNPGVFRGFADPSVIRDPAVTGRVWLAYSWPHVVEGRNPQGDVVQMAAVRTHLARSDDGGASFSFVNILWPDVPTPDPEGSGQDGIISSETASLVTMESEAGITWFGGHLRYFLEPQTGYNPRYATSWHVRIGAAASAEALASAEEAVLGVSTTHPAYAPDVRLDTLAGLPIQHCAFVNNPGLFVDGRTLYLVVECLAFIGTTADYVNTSTQLFATEPAGTPSSWTWRHIGALADHDLAVELGGDTILQPDLMRGTDGRPLLLLTPARRDVTAQVGTTGQGCVALELASINPPRIARDCSGQAIVRTALLGDGLGACTYSAGSQPGIIATRKGSANGNWSLLQSGLDP